MTTEDLEQRCTEIIHTARRKADKQIEAMVPTPSNETANMVGLSGWLNGIEGAVAEIAREVKYLAAEKKK